MILSESVREAFLEEVSLEHLAAAVTYAFVSNGGFFLAGVGR